MRQTASHQPKTGQYEHEHTQNYNKCDELKVTRYVKNPWIRNDISTFGGNQGTNWELKINGKELDIYSAFRGNQMGNKEKLFFIKEFQLINVEEMLE